MTHLSCALLLCLGLAFSILIFESRAAESGSGAEPVFVRSTALPAVRRAALSLALQGAPVPEELTELLHAGQEIENETDATAFMRSAELAFGAELPWAEGAEQGRGEDGTSAELPSNTRAYLARLITEAPAIAPMSPYAAEDIRAIATDLQRRAGNIRGREEQRSFVQDFGVALREIFPQKSHRTIATFRAHAEALLEDLPDALALFASEGASSFEIRILRKERERLIEALPYVEDEKDLALYLPRFEDFAHRLRGITPPTSPAALREDLQDLLRKLQEYLLALETQGISSSSAQQSVAGLLQELGSAPDAPLEILIGKLANLLEDLPQDDVSSPPVP